MPSLPYKPAGLLPASSARASYYPWSGASRPSWVRLCVRIREFLEFLEPAARARARDCSEGEVMVGCPGPLNRTPHKGLLWTAARRSTAAPRCRYLGWVVVHNLEDRCAFDGVALDVLNLPHV